MGKNNEIPLPKKPDAKEPPKKQVSRFGHNFTMHRLDKMGNRFPDPVQLVEDGPAKGYCKVNLVGYAMIPLEEFGSWRKRWRAVRMARRALKIIRQNIANDQTKQQGQLGE